MARRKQPGEDVPVAEEAGLTVLNAIREAKREAEDAKRTRMIKNRINRGAFLSEQDWSHKQTGQSTEFLPKASATTEQFSAFFKRGLVQFGDYFSVNAIRDGVLKPWEIKELLKCFLHKMPDGNKFVSFPVVLGDGIKNAVMESLVILKIHGRKVEERDFTFERGGPFLEEEIGEPRVVARPDKLEERINRPWKLIIDVVRGEDYFPDPTGRNLYEIHRSERDLHEVIELAEQGIYDIDAVEEIKGSFTETEEERLRTREQNQNVSQPPDFRKRVVIDEYWGDILDQDGKIAHKNIVAAVANDRFLIREPEPNPFWHQESPW